MTRSIILASAAATALLLWTPIGAEAQTPEATQSAPAEDATSAIDAATAAPSPSDAERLAAAKAFYDSLDRKTGRIDIVGGKVALTVPETHYFIGKEDARRVIVDTWGNPPEAVTGVEGMIFERDGNPMLDSWGAVVEYSADGHVADNDAATIDYAKLLADMQRDTRDANKARADAGYNAIELVGWAETPRYDQASHKLYWAKALQFADASSQTLNYDIRALGRDGVLVISFISGIDALPSIRAAAPAVLAMPQFAAGARYEDYKEGVDKKAAYGIAGLIAGGAAVALVKKAGLLGLILAFGKKFIVLAIAGAAGLFGVIGRMFGKKKEPVE
ncbi:MAG: DUF2167 domain-containing protein [Hyphomonadaceae bacterium]|nr:DUF2167 domain-containing protein [Hyphomonadaceae bacterium]